MYRTIDTSTWDDPKIRELDRDGKLLWIYLLTNRHSHVSGIYILPAVLIEHETGLKNRVLDTLWDTFSALQLSVRDKKNEVIWVRKMFFYQGRGAQNHRAAANHLASLHNTWIIKDFLDFYPQVKRYVKHTLSIPYAIGAREQIEALTQEQEQEQEQENVVLEEEKYKWVDVGEVQEGASDNGAGRAAPTLAPKPNPQKSIFEHWNQCPNLTHHMRLSPAIRTAINARLKDGWTQEQICASITRYAELVEKEVAPGYNRWTLSLLLTRGSGEYLDRMLDPKYKGICNGDNDDPEIQIAKRQKQYEALRAARRKEIESA